MMDQETICPYTGLRSFTEEESLYFKGREEHIIRVIEQLEQKKFLMVTGASGDGKSSLIFAGLIPEARAGFFKATYSNWHVVSFRPERSPLSNMARALASVPGLEDNTIVENELSHGFSSLTEIYKSSSLHLDQSDQSWLEAPADKRLTLERGAGNLLIVVDQFEEFFTNPENFPNSVPSQDARLVMNILLETVKISLRDNLPIYVVITMRSDYIGQCAAFRGLPEFIGFSQFFVPRLQRKELQQVIEEPAMLSGNRISKRLVDRLIYDLEDTEDHLPILQHVLKEIWKAADQGREEMDLVHYAMVGGISGDKLPKENIDRFQRWEEKLPEHQRHYLKTASLTNVLDIHATRLYGEAASHYNQKYALPISDKEARLIIGITFACLTRIDENRAVRNRMTLKEITNIINVPGITGKVVDDVLRPFRDQEHTLVRPFITEDSTSQVLGEDAVLDITHEALIRNWKLLNRWAMQEFDYYTTFLDFRKQLQRWIDNGKSADYLLPIGPLTYFENWMSNCRPNVYWINRYNTETGDAAEKLLHSQETLGQSRQFLKRSARKLLITKAFMKYGARRISIAAVVMVLAVVSAFFGYSSWTKRNDVVLVNLLTTGSQLLRDPYSELPSKSEFVLAAERLKPGFFTNVLKTLPDPNQQIEIAISIPELIFVRSRYSNPPLLHQALQVADSLMTTRAVPDFSKVKEVDSYLNHWNDLLNTELNYLYFKPNEKLQARRDQHARMVGRYVYQFFRSADPSLRWDKMALHHAMKHTLNFHALATDSLASLVTMISPFEGNQSARKKFEKLFPQHEKIGVGNNQTIEHNGGYEILAYLYASLGRVDRALMCTDTILKYHREYDLNFNNSSNIAAYFLSYEHPTGYLDFVTRYANRVGMSRRECMQAFVNRAGIFDIFQALRSIDQLNYNPNLALLSGEQLNKVYEILNATITQDVQDTNERNLLLALASKQQGCLLDKKYNERSEVPDSDLINRLFDTAFDLYRKIPARFLEEEVETLIMNDVNSFGPARLKRKMAFIYPDHQTIPTQSFFAGSKLFYGDAFFLYLKMKNSWASMYKTENEYSLLNTWVGSSFNYKDITARFSGVNQSYANFLPVSHDNLVLVDSLIVASGFEKQLDNSWVRLSLIRDYLAQKEEGKALQQLARLNYGNLLNGRRIFVETIPLNNFATQTAIDLIKAGHGSRVSPFIHRFKRLENRIVAYAEMGKASFRNGQRKAAEAYLDSVNYEFEQNRSITEFNYISLFDLRNGVVQLITLLKEQDGRKAILDITGSMGNRKVEGIAAWARAYASLDKYYDAVSVIPTLSNADDRLYIYSQILNNEVMKLNTTPTIPWREYDKGRNAFLSFVIYGFDFF